MMYDDSLPNDLISTDTLYSLCVYLKDNPIILAGVSFSGLIMALCFYLNNKEGK